MSSGVSAALLYSCTFSPPSLLGAVPEDSKGKEHHLKTGKGFVNPWDSYRDITFNQFFRDSFWRQISGRANKPDTTPPTIPVRKPTFLPYRTGEFSALRATWLGHACYYVEFPNGLRVLFDPVFEDRCSPFSWLGPKRYTEAPCTPAEIPIIDVVVISHSHYDHLSHPTILEIHDAHPNVLFAVPLGLKKWFKHIGIENAVELDWWESIDISLSPDTREKGTSSPSQRESPITARISCLPCQHTSARTLFDKACTLWASWSIHAGDKSVWFGGDTGYRAVPELPKEVDDYGKEYSHLPRCPAFQQIGELRGPFDLGLIPIGAYDPRYIMSSMHANPFDSVEIFTAIRCQRAMAIHHGTWVSSQQDCSVSATEMGYSPNADSPFISSLAIPLIRINRLGPHRRRCIGATSFVEGSVEEEGYSTYWCIRYM